ncbi:hypothetical protein NEMIN01_0714 [Nematocida minor]|uniref:uncharacterized protein n=1 Tax=Nematocida minor TaxID=1912983 RepID=UPI00221E71E5|nr:uncharacterized protein NEMIN01_0714 [Nematocida minor]KAI5189851.1 hypothetical protein NEMIN01_0714 [Nematocida minor]
MLRYFTVEYDGYTYKKEEKKEEEKTSGAHYLINTLTLCPSEKTELQKIISRMNTKSKWKDLSDKQERIYLKMEKILSKLKAYTPFSVPFLSKVSKREAPEYYNLIKNPIDLGKIGKKLFLQEYSDVNDFLKDLDLIWENCFKFNSTHGNIYAMYAQKMKEKSLVLLQDLFSEREIEIQEPQEEVDHFIQSEKQRKEMVATRAAILQNPAEFTCKRTGASMGEFWKQETEAIRQNQNIYSLGTINSEIDGMNELCDTATTNTKRKSSLYIPEYTHFYNSFPVYVPEPRASPPSYYTIDDLLLSGYTAYNKNSKAYKLGERMAQDKKLFYNKNFYTADNKAVNDIYMGRCEIMLLLKKIVTLELISTGFTSTEASALNILVSYAMHKIESAMKQLSEYKRRISHTAEKNTTENILKYLIHVFQLNSADMEPNAFFSEEEEDSDEESIINMIYSNPEDVDVEIDDDLI